jgi:hypothetical protein
MDNFIFYWPGKNIFLPLKKKKRKKINTPNLLLAGEVIGMAGVAFAIHAGVTGTHFELYSIWIR